MKKKSEAGDDIYKQLKLRLLHLFGPAQEDAFEEASNLVLTGKPSALAKRIIVLICDKPKPLEGCCCAKTVAALWKRQLPPLVRAAIAGMDMAGDLEGVLKKADDTYREGAAKGASVAAANLDETLPALQQPVQQPVAAVKQKTKKQFDTSNRGTPHPDGPPETACYLHWRFGKSAYTCKNKKKCPWKNYLAPKPKKDNKD